MLKTTTLLLSVLFTSIFFHGAALNVPAPAAMWGYNTRAFFDDFNSSSTIDVNNTKVAGFQWYVNGAWPNVPNASAWSTAPAVSAGDISVSAGELVIATGNNAGISSLNTAVALSGSNYRGTIISPGFYFEARFKFNPVLSMMGQAAWPILWAESIDFERGLITDGNKFFELDFFEAFPTANGNPSPLSSNRFQWIYSGGVYTGTHTTGQNLSATPDANYHTIGVLWVTSGLNSGTGLFQVYYDGVHQTSNDVTYSSGGTSTPGASGGAGNVNGLFFISESQKYSIMIGAGSGVPITIDYVAVWCASVACVTVQNWLEERYRPANDNDVSLRNAA